MSDDKRLRLLHFSVVGLFGEFDHSIPFNVYEHVTALIGPNGQGKTACLRLINALFMKHWTVFQETEFEKITYQFDDGTSVTVVKIVENEELYLPPDHMGVKFSVSNPGIDAETWLPRNMEVSPSKSRFVEAYLPFLNRVSPKTWIHNTTGKSYSIQEVVDNFGDDLPPDLVNSIIDMPSERLLKICSCIDCHLIETQRLLVISSDEARRSGGVVSTLAISRKAKLLREIINDEIRAYGITSQSLDRSFPRRVMQSGPIQQSDNLLDDLAKLDEKRSELMKVGILDPELNDTLPPLQTVNEALATLLSVYVRDTREKLQVLEGIKLKIQLFINLMNARFHPKSATVNKTKGIEVKNKRGLDVPLEKLSSGEQHQLVLFFELLFELKTNALILIDEPELSLHVSWQKQFVPDLVKIINLNQFDVLLATHSPLLIGEWDELIVELSDSGQE